MFNVHFHRWLSDAFARHSKRKMLHWPRALRHRRWYSLFIRWLGGMDLKFSRNLGSNLNGRPKIATKMENNLFMFPANLSWLALHFAFFWKKQKSFLISNFTVYPWISKLLHCAIIKMAGGLIFNKIVTTLYLELEISTKQIRKLPSNSLRNACCFRSFTNMNPKTSL